MHKPIPGGFLVVIEGIDGAGKTTQANILAEACARQNLLCETSKEPTDGKYGVRARQAGAAVRLELQEELDLFMLDRHEHVENVIQPALDAGGVVILDRYYFSNAAYQGARGADPAAILRANAGFAPEPDMLVILDVPCDVGLGRVRERGDVPNVFEREEMLRKVRSIFLSIAHPNLVSVNGLLPEHKVAEQILAVFKIFAAQKIAIRSGLTEKSAEAVHHVMYG